MITILQTRLSILFLAACGDKETVSTISETVFSDISTRIHDDIKSLVYVSWTQSDDDDVLVEYSFDDGEWLSTPSQSVAADASAEVLLLGVPYGMTVTYRLVGDSLGVSTEHTVTIDDAPEALPEPSLALSDPLAYHAESGYLLGSINADDVGWSAGDYWKFIIDRQGRYVWAMETPDKHWSIYLRQSRDGTAILWDEATYWSDFSGEGEDGQVHRMKIDGTITSSLAFLRKYSGVPRVTSPDPHCHSLPPSTAPPTSHLLLQNDSRVVFFLRKCSWVVTHPLF